MFVLKKQWIAVISISSALLVGCGANNNRLNDNDRLYPKNGNTISVSDENEIYNRNQSADNENFGFVRQVKNPVPGKSSDTKPVKWMDREKTAHMISTMTVGLPNVIDSSVVVTDQEVLIAYAVSDKGKKARFETADQVKKTAMSAIPRWYHVYVTDDPTLRQDVENIASMNTTFTQKDRTVKNTVMRMLESSPQGRKMNDGENANGETINETNKKLEKTNYRQQFESNTGR